MQVGHDPTTPVQVPLPHVPVAMQPVDQHDGGVGVGVDNSDTASEDSNTKHNASGFNPSEPRPSQRLKDAKAKMDNAYVKREAARDVVNRITKELQAAVSYLDECSTEYKKECEAFRLIELGDPSQWVREFSAACGLLSSSRDKS